MKSQHLSRVTVFPRCHNWDLLRLPLTSSRGPAQGSLGFIRSIRLKIVATSGTPLRRSLIITTNIACTKMRVMPGRKGVLPRGTWHPGARVTFGSQATKLHTSQGTRGSRIAIRTTLLLQSKMLRQPSLTRRTYGRCGALRLINALFRILPQRHRVHLRCVRPQRLPMLGDVVIQEILRSYHPLVQMSARRAKCIHRCLTSPVPFGSRMYANLRVPQSNVRSQVCNLGLHVLRSLLPCFAFFCRSFETGQFTLRACPIYV